MQPYFLPYIGYFQLINMVDHFVIYDNIQYTKKGWINRNRFLQNGKDYLFSIPLKKDSDFLNVTDRKLDNNFDKVKLLNKIKGAYSKAPHYNTAYPIIEEVINYNECNLFFYILNSVISICKFLDINTKITKSSEISIDHSLSSQNKVLAFCKELETKTYINPIGGQNLYEKEKFEQSGFVLKFIRTNDIKYKQFEKPFVSNLSILDLMMFNTKEEICRMLDDYNIVE